MGIINRPLEGTRGVVLSNRGVAWVLEDGLEDMMEIPPFSRIIAIGEGRKDKFGGIGVALLLHEMIEKGGNLELLLLGLACLMEHQVGEYVTVGRRTSDGC